MKNWKTTAGGIVAALGLFLIGQTNPIAHLVGQILAPLAVFITGVVTADSTPAA